MDPASVGDPERAASDQDNTNTTAIVPRRNIKPLTQLGLPGKTSSGPPTEPQAPQGNHQENVDESDDDWNIAVTPNLSADEDDSDNELLSAPIPSRVRDEYDDDALAEDPTDTPTQLLLEGKASSVYASIRKTAQAISVDLETLREFILTNPDVLELAADHQQSYVKPLEAKAGANPRGNAHSIDAVIDLIMVSEVGTGVSPYRAPPKSKVDRFEPINHLAYSVYRMHDRLNDSGLPIEKDAGTGAVVQPVPDTVSDIMDALDAETKRHQQRNPVETARRARALAIGQLTLADHIKKMKKDADRKKAYVTLQSLLRTAVRDFFNNFTEVDVSAYREACLAQFEDPKPTPDTIRAHDMTGEVNVSVADKEQRKEETTAALSSQWAGEEARAMDVDNDCDDVNNPADLPPPSKQYKDMVNEWSEIINSLEYQDERLKAALTRCYISDINAMRVLGQTAAMRLHWWQVICIAWCDYVVRRFGDDTNVNGHTGWTKGGLVADEIGLGKTTEYNGFILLTVDKIRKLSKKPYIVAFHSASKINTSLDTVHVSLVSQLKPVWDKTNHRNLRTVVVSSYDTFCRQYGPAAQNAWCKKVDARFQSPPTGKQPDAITTCPFHPAGLVRAVIVDEPQLGCRNQSSYWTTVKWLEADQVFLYSGSPAPRGLNDIASYLGLFEHTDVAKDALRPHTVEGDIVWAPDTDPYSLRDDDPRCKFRYTRHCFLMHIVNADKLSDYEKGMRAKKVMPHFILRRDYQSQCPFESGNSIAKNLPDLTHLSLERTFTPSAKALYDRAADDWRNRLVLLDKDPVTGDVRRMPNPQAYRADALQVWYPYTVWLHVPNKHLVPADLREDVQAMAPVSGSTPQNDIDYYSWFSENSKH
ncbi:hypothetical protein E8E12_000340 [Didymella heteroderae]|uniref:SNF2 N-terminal domain-containing protein n=1 Tax=Didymella heteroderae TaxID=1769908 RepID=A0A9P4WFH8_9PLEO|nr:hypothetical protein E8E12_000340 [Didymella heteroderae]